MSELNEETVADELLNQPLLSEVSCVPEVGKITACNVYQIVELLRRVCEPDHELDGCQLCVDFAGDLSGKTVADGLDFLQKLRQESTGAIQQQAELFLKDMGVEDG